MKISTRKTYSTRSSQTSAPSRRIPTNGKKSGQKVAKNRISLRALFARARKIGKLAGVACIAGIILFLGIQFYHSEKFRLRIISISGCREVDPQKVEQIVRESVPERILEIDMAQLRDRLKQHPWIRDVEIRRVLPSGLTIYVDERKPSVILEMQGRLMIADSEGILLDRYDPRYGKLDVPVFKGVSGKDIDSYRSSQTENSLRVHHALEMLSEIESGEPQHVRRISEVDISEWNNLKIMMVDNPFVISLGEKDYLKRFRSLLRSDKYEQYKNNPDLVEVDVSLGNSIIYSFAGDGAAAVRSKAEKN